MVTIEVARIYLSKITINNINLAETVFYLTPQAFSEEEAASCEALFRLTFADTTKPPLFVKFFKSIEEPSEFLNQYTTLLEKGLADRVKADTFCLALPHHMGAFSEEKGIYCAVSPLASGRSLGQDLEKNEAYFYESLPEVAESLGAGLGKMHHLGFDSAKKDETGLPYSFYCHRDLHSDNIFSGHDRQKKTVVSIIDLDGLVASSNESCSIQCDMEALCLQTFNLLSLGMNEPFQYRTQLKAALINFLATYQENFAELKTLEAVYGTIKECVLDAYEQCANGEESESFLEDCLDLENFRAQFEKFMNEVQQGVSQFHTDRGLAKLVL